MISVIICTYNRERYISEVLQSLSLTSYKDFEVILIDNNSTDSTQEKVYNFKGKHPDFPLKVFLEKTQGLSWARNRGIKEASGDILAFIDDDATVRPDFLENLSKEMDSHPQAQAFGGKIIPVFDDCPPPKWLCRFSMGWVSALDMGKTVCDFRDRKFPIGANMGFRREVLQSCGEFNPMLGRNGGNLMGGEEKDLFNRIKKAGYSILYFPDVVVEHHIPQSRTTLKYVKEFANGVGLSERLRSKYENSYPLRLLEEVLKWVATLLLFFFYAIIGRPTCAATLVLFRAFVTRALLIGK